MVRIEVRILFARNGPFDVPPATSLHGLAGIGRRAGNPGLLLRLSLQPLDAP
jgi:hypothetical protein